MSEHKVREAKEASDVAERKQAIVDAFEKDPGSVLLRGEIVFGAVATNNGGYGIQCGEYPSGMVKQVCFDLLFRAMMMFQHLEFTKAMAEQKEKKIITR